MKTILVGLVVLASFSTMAQGSAPSLMCDAAVVVPPAAPGDRPLNKTIRLKPDTPTGSLYGATIPALNMQARAEAFADGGVKISINELGSDLIVSNSGSLEDSGFVSLVAEYSSSLVIVKCIE